MINFNFEMTRIGLLSDTHGYLDEAVFTHFEQCDEIWHAGDFGPAHIAERLSQHKKTEGCIRQYRRAGHPFPVSSPTCFYL